VYDSGRECSSGHYPPTKMRLMMYCDQGKESPEYKYEGYEAENCEVKVKFISKNSCYRWSVNPLMRWLGENQMILGIVLIALGLAVGLFGKKIFKPAICMIGSLAATLFLSLLIFSLFLSRDTSSLLEWIMFTLCAVLGIFAGLIFAYLVRLGVGVLAGWGGFCLGLILYNLFLYKIDNSGKAAFWSFTIGLALIAAVLSLWLFWHAIIIATSISGSYAFIRGISMYAGGFPDELEIY
jgi:hypothetical protein